MTRIRLHVQPHGALLRLLLTASLLLLGLTLRDAMAQAVYPFHPSSPLYLGATFNPSTMAVTLGCLDKGEPTNVDTEGTLSLH